MCCQSPDKCVLIAGTFEPASLALRYRKREDLPFDVSELPGAWPGPKDPLFPFSADLVDFLRPVGPGVYVGQGWMLTDDDPNGRQFLPFILVRSPSEV